MDRRGNAPELVALQFAPTIRARPTAPGGAPGLVVAAKYELVREIGRGGMGVVWQANHRGWDAPVAVKLSTLPNTSMAQEYFHREARVAAQLRGDHVVQVLDHGVDDVTGTPFIVMERLVGESLGARLARLGTISPRELLLIMTQVERAVSRVHAANLVHRDLKPDNIFLTPNDSDIVVKVLDFGVAKPLEEVPLDTLDITTRRSVAGTAWYMSPEHISGAKSNPRGDLWSLAVIACECLTGRRPFDASDLPSLGRRLWSEDRPVPSQLGPVPAGFDEWFAKATALDVGQRFHTAHELIEALRPICRSSSDERIPPLSYDAAVMAAPSMAPVFQTVSATRRWSRARLASWTGVGLFVGAATVGAAYLVWSPRTEGTEGMAPTAVAAPAGPVARPAAAPAARGGRVAEPVSPASPAEDAPAASVVGPTAPPSLPAAPVDPPRGLGAVETPPRRTTASRSVSSGSQTPRERPTTTTDRKPRTGRERVPAAPPAPEDHVLRTDF